jgi:hypothetical protein
MAVVGEVRLLLEPQEGREMVALERRTALQVLQ